MRTSLPNGGGFASRAHLAVEGQFLVQVAIESVTTTEAQPPVHAGSITCDGGDEAVPVRGLGGELLVPRRGNRVELRAPIGLDRFHSPFSSPDSSSRCSDG